MKRKVLLLSSLFLVIGVMGQETNELTVEEEKGDRISIGFMGGVHLNFTNYSNINEDVFSDVKMQGSGVHGFFLQYEWGKKRQFAIRPEFAFLSRNIRVSGIDGYWADKLKLSDYHLKANYFDIRVPVIYNFGKPVGSLRPYIYVAPIIGFVTGGEISLDAEDETGDSPFDMSVHTDLSKSSMASSYFAAAIGAGIKHSFALRSHSRIDVGLEASYEYGFTDTFSDDEKDGKVENTIFLFSSKKAEGSRKFGGLEIKAWISVPFSIFSKKKSEPVYVPSVVKVTPIEPPVVKTEPKVEEKPCYTLEEILYMVDNKQSIEGKVICAVDVIHFDFGKSTITNKSYNYLDKLAALILNAKIKVEVKGHTDNVGAEEFNMNLSQQRAKAVYEYLIGKGVSKDALVYSYYGMSRPLESNETEVGRTRNRRVEFEILTNK